MIVHKVNMDHIANEAEQARKAAESRGDFPDLKYYEWVIGQNCFRILPPYNAKGLLWKKQVQHFRLPPDNKIIPCYLGSYPDKADSCFVCDALEKILKMFPELNLKRQGPSDQYRLVVIDRRHEDKGPQIVRFTAALKNWVSLKIDDPKIGDITDIESGIDITVDMSKKKRKDGKDQTTYTPDFVPRPCPLHEDDEVIAAWCSQIPDLDKVFKYPKEEWVADHHDYVDRMVAHYIRKHRSGGVGAIDRQDDEGSKQPPSRDTDPPSSLEGLDPRDLPSCFAGLKNPEPHTGDGVPKELAGSVGHNEALEKCMLCPSELRCIDAKAARGD